MEIRTNGLEDAFYGLLRAFQDGNNLYDAAARGNKSKDLLECQLIIEDPRDRLILHPQRKTNLTAVIGETLCYLNGSDAITDLSYYIPSIAKYSDDGLVLASGYGRSVLNALPMVVQQLREDPDSKRAVIPILDSSHVPNMLFTKDFPCTDRLQYFIRGGKLHASTSMRSQDVFWGLQHDVFFFTFLQERIALELGIPLGTYRHTATMFNLYERHYDRAVRILQSGPCSSSAMPSFTNLADLHELLRIEPHIRTASESELVNIPLLQDKLLNDFRNVLLYKKTENPTYIEQLRTSACRTLMVRS